MTSVERAVGAEDASNNGDVVGSVRDERGAVGVSERLIDEVGAAIVNTDLRPDLRMSDNVAIMVVSSYEDDPDCPDEEPDEELHWKPWALEQEKALRRRMALAAILAYEKHMRRTAPQQERTAPTSPPAAQSSSAVKALT